MRKIVFWMGVSVDGFMEAPGHDIGWSRVDEELHRYMNEELAQMGVFLEGRVTYELMADVWPTAGENPEFTETMREFGGIWTDMPKYLYSRTVQHADWNTTVVHDVVPDEIEALKAQPGGDMVVGGANLAATFIDLGLVDEYRIYVHPVVIGDGTPMFPRGQWLDLRHVETRTFGNGVVLLRYERA